MVDVSRNNLYVGRPFFVEPKRNAIYYWKKARRGIVTSIGRKYFYVGVEGSKDVLRFEVESGAYAYEKNGDCNANYVLYDSEGAYLNHMRADAEKVKICRYVRDTPLDCIPDIVASAIYKMLLENGLVSPIKEGDGKV